MYVILEVLLKRCPFFDEMDEIYGTRTNINPPYLHDSSISIESIMEDIQLQNSEEYDMPGQIEQEIGVTMSSRNTVQSHTSTNKNKRKSSESTGLEILGQTALLRFEVQQGELELSKEKWEDEKRRRDSQYELDLKKFDHEQKMDMERIELEKTRLKKSPHHQLQITLPYLLENSQFHQTQICIEL